MEWLDCIFNVLTYPTVYKNTGFVSTKCFNGRKSAESHKEQALETMYKSEWVNASWRLCAHIWTHLQALFLESKLHWLDSKLDKS